MGLVCCFAAFGSLARHHWLVSRLLHFLLTVAVALLEMTLVSVALAFRNWGRTLLASVLVRLGLLLCLLQVLLVFLWHQHLLGWLRLASAPVDGALRTHVPA